MMCSINSKRGEMGGGHIQVADEENTNVIKCLFPNRNIFFVPKKETHGAEAFVMLKGSSAHHGGRGLCKRVPSASGCP